MQIRHDLLSGTLHCNSNTAAILASYIVQSEFGDLTDESGEILLAHCYVNLTT